MLCARELTLMKLACSSAFLSPFLIIFTSSLVFVHGSLRELGVELGGLAAVPITKRIIPILPVSYDRPKEGATDNEPHFKVYPTLPSKVDPRKGDRVQPASSAVLGAVLAFTDCQLAMRSDSMEVECSLALPVIQ